MIYAIAVQNNGPIIGSFSLGLSQTSEDLEKKCNNLYNHFTKPISREEDIPAIKFYTLKEEWENDIKYSSSISNIALHPAYQQIIGMGEIAISYILNELKNNQGHWFWALSSITGENPVSSKDMGNMKKMRLSWLKWGKINGYL